MAKATKKVKLIQKEIKKVVDIEEITILLELSEVEAGFLLCLFGSHGGKLEQITQTSSLLHTPGHRLPIPLQEAIKKYKVGDTNAIYHALAEVLEL